MPNPFGFLFGQRPASQAGPGLMPLGQALTTYGPAPIANLVGNHIARDVFPQPYVGPGQLDRDGSETAEMRANYDRVYREEPAVRSAVRGKVDSIIELDANVRPKNKASKYDVLAADLCQWAVEETDAGFDGLLDMMLTPACVHGHSFTEKVMKPAPWERQGELGVPYVWTFDQFHSLDVAWIKLQLDVYWNVTAIVNIRRGLEYYSPDCVLRYAHNGMYGNPFGQSDLRAVWRAAHIIEQAYKLWLIAAQVFGLPFIKAKAGSKERVKMLTTAMAGLRGAGYAIIDKDDDIEAINLASATGSDMFSGMIKTLREDAFLSIRGSYTPFLEGQGGENAHNDSEVSEDQANSTEKAMIKRASRVIRKQLFTWVVRANCPPGTGIPELHFGGTDRDKQLKFFQVVKAAQDVGVTLDADWVCTTGDVVSGEPGKQLQPPQPPQAPPGPQALPPGPGGPPPAGPPALPPKSPPPAPAATFADAPGHNPPFPGAVYNPADHRYHKPQGTDAPDDGRKPEPTPPADPNSVGHAEAADSRAKRILKRLAGVPAVAAMAAVSKAKSTYKKYEQRYGPAYAKAIVAAGVIGLPVPAPGASVALMAAVRGIAELHRLLRKRAGQQFADAAPLDPELIRRLGAAFVAEITDGTDTPAEQVARMAADLLDRAGFGDAFADYDEKAHPRDDRGRFVDKEEMEWAKSDKGVADELRARVTKPEERAKLEAMIGGEKKPEAPKQSPPQQSPPPEPNTAPVAPDARPFNPESIGARDEQQIAWARKEAAGWKKQLDPHEVGAVKAYSTEAGCSAINGALRKGEAGSPDIESHVKALDAALSKSELPHDLKLYRGLSRDPKFTPGTQIEDKGFVSTSALKDVAEVFAGADGNGVLVEIKARKGSKGAALDGMSASEEELEITLPRNSRFLITGVRKDGRHTIYEAEYV